MIHQIEDHIISKCTWNQVVVLLVNHTYITVDNLYYKVYDNVYTITQVAVKQFLLYSIQTSILFSIAHLE